MVTVECRVELYIATSVSGSVLKEVCMISYTVCEVRRINLRLSLGLIII